MSVDTGLLLRWCLATVLAMTPLSVVAAKDPTRPPGGATAVSGATVAAFDYRLESVIFGKERRLAIINGQRVKVGEQVGTAKVVKIEASAVTLLWQGQYKRLLINKSSIKKWVKRDSP